MKGHHVEERKGRRRGLPWAGLPFHSRGWPESSGMESTKSSPSDADLLAALVVAQTAVPDVGAAKLHAAILAAHPDWVVAEKRLRKTLRIQRGEEQPTPPAPTPTSPKPKAHSGRRKKGPKEKEPAVTTVAFPDSQPNADLKVGDFTSKVRVTVFDSGKGKGLVATQAIKEGEVVWKEEPFVYSPSDW